MVDDSIREDIEAEEVEEDQYLVFTIQSQEFGIQAMCVQEISQVLETTEVPNAPPYIDGIVNLRGRLASVVNFRKKFGFESKEHDEDTRIIIVEHAGFPIGIVVDSVEEVIKIPEEAVQELPQTTSTAVSEEFMAGVGMLGERLIILLDVEEVLTKTELGEVEAVRQAIDAVETLSEEGKDERVEDEG